MTTPLQWWHAARARLRLLFGGRAAEARSRPGPVQGLRHRPEGGRERSRLGGGIPVTRESINLAKVVHDVIDEISAANPKRAIEVDTRQEQVGEWDAARISQALTNLIGNAVEHSAPDSTVTVRIDDDEEDVVIAIHNRGSVIQPERLDGLFNPMKVTAPKATASGPTGILGLGLYIAERIVDAHGGRVEVESMEETGTTFTVHLPRHEPGEDATSGQAEQK